MKKNEFATKTSIAPEKNRKPSVLELQIADRIRKKKEQLQKKEEERQVMLKKIDDEKLVSNVNEKKKKVEPVNEFGGGDATAGITTDSDFDL